MQRLGLRGLRGYLEKDNFGIVITWINEGPLVDVFCDVPTKLDRDVIKVFQRYHPPRRRRFQSWFRSNEDIRAYLLSAKLKKLLSFSY